MVFELSDANHSGIIYLPFSFQHQLPTHNCYYTFRMNLWRFLSQNFCMNGSLEFVRHHLMHVKFGYIFDLLMFYFGSLIFSKRITEVWSQTWGLWKYCIGFWQREWKVSSVCFWLTIKNSFFYAHSYNKNYTEVWFTNCLLADTFSGSRVAATDLRGGMSLVLARLASEGTTEIREFHILIEVMRIWSPSFVS